MRQRRQFIRTGATAGMAWLAGCPDAILEEESTPTDSTVSWAAAFEQRLQSYDRSALEDSPIVLERVETKSEVKNACSVLGWIRAIEEIPERNLRDLEAAAELARAVRERLVAARDRLEASLALVDAMKNTPEGAAVSVWDAATTVYPTLEEVEELSRDLRSQLDSRADQARRVAETTRTVLSHFERVRSSRVTAFDELADAISRAISEYSTIIDSVTNVERRLSRLREISQRSAAIADQLPALGDRVESVFSGLASVLSTVLDRFEAFRTALSDRRGDLRAVSRAANRWANQRYAEITRLAIDSIEELDVTEIDTGLDAYDAGRVESVPTAGSRGIDAVVVLGRYGSRDSLVQELYRSADDVGLPILVNWDFNVAEMLPGGVPTDGSLTTMSRAAGPGWETFRERYAEEYGAERPVDGFMAVAYDASAVSLLANLAAGANHGPAIREHVRTVSNPPGETYGPERLAEAATAVASGETINYTGASGIVDFDGSGAVTGYTYRVDRQSAEETTTNTVVGGRAGPSDPSAEIPGSGRDRTVKLGILTTLSGGGPVRIGNAFRNAARLPALRLERSSPYSVDVRVADAEWAEDAARSAARTLVDAGCPAINRGILKNGALEQTVLVPNDIVTFTALADVGECPFLYNPYPSKVLNGEALGREANRRGISTVSVLYDDASETTTDSFEDEFEGRVRRKVRFEPGQSGYESAIETALEG